MKNKNTKTIQFKTPQFFKWSDTPSMQFVPFVIFVFVSNLLLRLEYSLYLMVILLGRRIKTTARPTTTTTTEPTTIPTTVATTTEEIVVTTEVAITKEPSKCINVYENSVCMSWIRYGYCNYFVQCFCCQSCKSKLYYLSLTRN